MSDTQRIIHERISTQAYDPFFSLTDQEVRELIADATEAPSSFNIQHWRFVAVTDPAKKEELKAAAMGQAQITDSAVTFIVLGDLEGHQKVGEILNRSVDAGIMPRDVAYTWTSWATAKYADDPVAKRDEAIRSASLAAMLLMLAARSRGWCSGPMIGFDPEQVKSIFGIAEHYVPVMFVTVGKSSPGNMRRKIRLGVDEVLSFNQARSY